jgi:hypothetical protein
VGDCDELAYSHALPVGAINRQLPFKAKVPLAAIVRGVRDDRNEQRAALDLLADLLIPRVPAAQFALIEEDLDIGCAQCLGNLLGCPSILRGIGRLRPNWFLTGQWERAIR